MENIEGQKRINYTLVLAASLLCVLMYLPCLHADWQLDDNNHIVFNPAITGERISDVFSLDFWGQGREDATVWAYRPLTTLSNRLVYKAAPIPFATRVVNLLLFICACWWLFYLLMRFASPYVAAFSVCIFMLHPVHGSVIAYAVGRAEILTMLFMVGCFSLYHSKHYRWALLVFFIGLFAKESMSLIFPIILIHALVIRRWRKVSEVVGYSLPFILIIGINFLIHYWVSGRPWMEISPASNPLVNTDTSLQYMHRIAFPGWYLQRLVFPTAFPAIQLQGSYFALSHGDPRLLIGILTATCTLGVALFLAMSKGHLKAMGIGILLFFVLGIFAFQWHGLSGYFLPDRLISTPLIGLTFSLACLIEYGGKWMGKLTSMSWKGWTHVGGVAISLAMACFSFDSLPAFSSTEKLALAQLKNSPNSPTAYRKLGFEYLGRGEHETSLKHFKKSLEILPTSIGSRRGLVLALEKIGRKDKALVLAEQLYNDSRSFQICWMYSKMLADRGRHEEGLAVLENISNPHPITMMLQSHIMLKVGREEEARKLVDEACQMDASLPVCVDA